MLNARLEETLELLENRPVGTLVGYAFVTDAEAGSSGRLSCYSATSHFSLVDATGEHSYRVLSARSFDRELTPVVALRIRCSDGGIGIGMLDIMDYSIF